MLNTVMMIVVTINQRGVLLVLSSALYFWFYLKAIVAYDNRVTRHVRCHCHLVEIAGTTVISKIKKVGIEVKKMMIGVKG